MKFVCEYYLKAVKKVSTEVVEAEDIAAAVEFGEGRDSEFVSLVNVYPVED